MTGRTMAFAKNDDKKPFYEPKRVREGGEGKLSETPTETGGGELSRRRKPH